MTADVDGHVIGWKNMGTLLNEDLVPHGNNGAAGENAIVLAQSDVLGSVVRFDKTDFLTAQTSNNLGLEEGGSFYVAMVVDYAGGEQGLFGVYPDGCTQTTQFPFNNDGTLTYKTFTGCYANRLSFQFGALEKSGASYREHNLSFGMGVTGKTLFSCLGRGDVSYGYIAGGHSTSYQNLEHGGPLSQIERGKLRVGHCGFCSTALLGGDVAELRIYNRPMTAAMRFAVEGELAAKYGFSLSPTAETDKSDVISAETLSGFAEDPCAFGDVPAGGAPAAEISCAGTCGGLTVAFAEVPERDASMLVYVGNNGAEGAAKVWCVAGGKDAKSLPLTVTLDATFAEIVQKKDLYWGYDGTWSRVVLCPTAEGSFVGSIPASWQNFQLTFRSETTAVVPAVWFSADTGVSLDDGGNVTKWSNLGTLGADLDVGPGGSGAGVRVVQNDQFGTALRFDGEHYLYQLSDKQTSVGIKDDVGGTCFAVVDIPDATRGTGNADPMIFGLWTGVDSWQWHMFSLVFNSNSRWFLQNFFGGSDSQYSFSPGNYKPGKRLLSVTGASSFVFGLGQVGTDGGRVMPNAKDDTICGSWSGKSENSPGLLGIGYNVLARSDYHILNGDIAEIRVYSRPLSATEQAAVELELAVKYGFAVQTVGTVDPSAISAHATGAKVIGGEAYRGPKVSSIETSWSDGTLTFAFKEPPPPPPMTMEEGAGVKSLTYLGSSGGQVRFSPRTASSSIQDFDRTWYLASACPSYGGVFDFAVDTSDAAEWRYVLYCRENGTTGFVRQPEVPVVTDGKVEFAFDNLKAGTYRLSRRPANIGLSIVIR